MEFELVKGLFALASAQEERETFTSEVHEFKEDNDVEH